MNPVDMDKLHARIAEALGWRGPEDCRAFSLQTLRELVRPVSPKLADEVTQIIKSGEVVSPGWRPASRARMVGR